MSKNNKQIRIDKSPKEKGIFFNKYKERDWNYLNIINYKNTKIEGKLKRKVNILSKKEEKIYNNIKIYPQPNTIRTILPEYGPNPTTKTSKKIVNTKSFSLDEKRIDKGKRKTNINKESVEQNEPYKMHTKKAKYRDYKITQITTLPGKIIRDINSIKDDKNDINKIKEHKSKTIYYNNKVKNDYCSNVACLPNSLNIDMDDKKMMRGKSYNKFNYKNKNEFNIFNNAVKSKIKRDKNENYKERPFSSCRYYNINNNVNYNNENENNNIRKYKNAESYQSFDMLKPSSILQKKYELRVKQF